MNVVIIEDDINIVDSVKMILRLCWEDAVLLDFSFGSEGLKQALLPSTDIVILDIGLPDINGFDVLQSIRQKSDVPVIVLTALSDEESVVKALAQGADDFIRKPFRQLEFIARIKAALRKKTTTLEPSATLVCPLFTLDAVKRTATGAGKEIRLTNIEALILQTLMTANGAVVSIPDLAIKIWGSDYANASEAIRTHVKNLRRKLYEITELPVVCSKTGIGYYFDSSAIV
jgi:DNA-binding response OmpR family regulator